MVVEAQVAEHHDAAKQQCRGVGLILAGNVWCRAMNSLHQGQTIGSYRAGRPL